MIKRLFFPVYAGLIGLLSLSSCDNTLEVNAPYQETMVIYGLLNPVDSMQYIRVNKAFVNTGNNALEIAKNSDSLFFDSLEVTLTNTANGQLIPLEAYNGIQKDSGMFAYDVNTLYRVKTPISPTGTYGLTVRNKLTGNVCTAVTTIVSNPNVIAPSKDSVTSQFNAIPGQPFTFRFQSGKNARAYDVVFRYHIENSLVSDTTQTSMQTLDFKVIDFHLTLSANGSEEQLIRVDGDIFYRYLAQVLPVDNSIRRRLIKVDYFYYGGSDDLMTYIQVNKPSLGIVQKKPEYTNIKGQGLGLFSSRNIYPVYSVKPSANTLGRLSAYSVTKPLNFLPY